MGVENIELVGIGQFIDISGNFGRITQGIFGDQAFNSGLIYTTAVFSNSSNNTGVVLSAAFFEDIATNNGFLSSIALFDDLSINNGSIILSAAFLGQANNSGTVYGSASFSASAINDTTGIVGQANFLGTAVNAGSVTIALFADSAINSGSISLSALFAGSSSNAPGATVVIAVFNEASTNSGTVSLSASFNDTAANNITGIIPVAIFNGSSVNNGYIINVATFNGTSSNGLNGIVTEATFADTSTNAGSATSATFGDSSSNLSTGIISNATFTATSVNAGSAISASFLDEASNSPTGQVTTAVFSASSVNSGTVIQQALFEGLATNSNTGNVQGTVTFSGSAVNTGTVAQAIFLDFASNTGTVTTSATFADSAANSGTVQGDAVFSDTTTNTGTIQGNAQIAPTATDSGTVIGNTVIFEHLYSYANSTYWSDDAVLVDGSIIYTGRYTLVLAASANFIIGTDGTAGFGSVSTNEAGIADVTLVDHPQSNGTQTYGSTVWWDDTTIISGTVVYAGQYTNSVAINSTFYIGTNGQDGYASVLTDNNGVVTSISLINNPYSSGGYYYLNSNLGDGDTIFTGQYTNDVAANITFYIGTDGQAGYTKVDTNPNGIASLFLVDHAYSSSGYYYDNATLSVGQTVYTGQYSSTVAANISFYIGTNGEQGYSYVTTDANGAVTAIIAINHAYSSGGYYFDNTSLSVGDLVYTGQYSSTIAANVSFSVGTEGVEGYSIVTTDANGAVTTITAINHGYSSGGYYYDNSTLTTGDIVYTGQYSLTVAANASFFIGTDGQEGYSSVTTDGSGIATISAVNHPNSSGGYYYDNSTLTTGDIVYTGQYSLTVAANASFFIGTDGQTGYASVATDANGAATVTLIEHTQHDASFNFWWDSTPLVNGAIIYTGAYTNTVAANSSFVITGYLVNTDSSGAATLTVLEEWYQDSSDLDHTVVLYGAITQSDEGNGIKAASFDGSTSYLHTDPINLGTGDLTLELFVNHDSDDTNIGVFLNGGNGGLQFGHYIGGNNTLYIGLANIADTLVNNNTQIAGDWHHIAYVRSGGTGTFYVDGVSVISGPDNNDYGNNPIDVGAFVGYGAGNYDFKGKMAAIRITTTAVYTSNFVVPTTVPTSITGTQLLLNFGATAVPTLSWYKDTSSVARVFTLTGAPEPSDEGSGIKAVQFNGSSYLSTAYSEDFSFGEEDFTIELFVKLSTSDNKYILSTSYYYNGWVLRVAPGGNTIQFHATGNNVAQEFPINTTKNVVDNLWHHIAVSRVNGTATLYVDGIAEGSATLTNIIHASGYEQGLHIGGGGGGTDITGKLAAIRIVKGTALYTQNFVVPTSLPTAVSNTKLLMTFGATAIPNVQEWYEDYSSVAQAITLNGGVTQSDEGAGVRAAQFNGTNGYLNINSFSFDLSQDSTIEFWMKPTQNGQNTILGYAIPNVSGQLNIGIDNNNQFFVNNAYVDVGGAFAPNFGTWQHVAIVTESGVKKIYKNGVLQSTNTQSFNNLTSLNIGYLYGYYAGKLAGFRMVAGTALYTNNFTVPTTLPTAITGTQLLLNFGATAAPYVVPWHGDNSSAARIVALNGTITQEDEGNGVLVADFNDGYFSVVNPMSLATGDFTVEYFIKYDSSGIGYQPGLALYTPNTGDYNATFISYIEATNYFNILMTNSAGDTWQTWVPGADSGLQVSPIANRWNHVAATRSQNTLSLYLNGTLIGTNTITDSVYDVNRILEIGRYTAFPGGSRSLYGRITGLRIVKGAVLYSGSSYTIPTTLPTNVSGTELLLNFGATAAPTVIVSNWYDDSSSAARIVTLNGTVTQSDEGGGVIAADFDGSLDYFSTSNIDFGDNQFTIEGFFKPNSLNQMAVLFGSSNGGGTQPKLVVYVYNGNLRVELLNESTQSPLETPLSNVKLNEWNHIALIRDSQYNALYINGVRVDDAPFQSTTGITALFYVGWTGEVDSFDGLIAGFRVVVGTALYGGSTLTIPTSLPTNVSGTELLLNFGATAAPTVIVPNWYDDASSTPSTSTTIGTVTQFNEGGGVKAALVAATSQITYAAADVGAGLEDSTVEFFINFVTINEGEYGIPFTINDGTSNSYTLVYGANVYASSVSYPVLRLTSYFQGMNVDGFRLYEDVWYHIAVVRHNQEFKIYINGTYYPFVTQNGGPDLTGATWNLASSTDFVLGNNALNNNFKIVGLRAIKGVALYTSNFTVPTTLPTAITGTELLLNFGATAAPSIFWYTDSSSAAHSATLNGSVTRSNEGGGVKAANFSGASYITYAHPTNFNFGSGDFTIEMFINPSYTYTSNQGALITTAEPTDSQGLLLSDNIVDGEHRFMDFLGNGNWLYAFGETYGTVATNFPTYSVNAWQHIAWVRSGNTFTLYKNGVSVKSYTANVTLTNSNNLIAVGGRSVVGSYFTGKIAAVRVVKGSAIYTSNFSIPTSLPTAVSGTTLLLNFGATAVPTVAAFNWYDDLSPSANTLTLNGSITQSNEGNGVIAASFDGNSSITIPPNSNLDISSSSFTIELWFKLNGYDAANSTALISKDTVAYAHRGSYEIGAFGNKVYFAYSSSDPWGAPEYQINSVQDISLNTWYHVAVSREYSTNTLRFFLNGVLQAEEPFITMQDFGRAITIGRTEKDYPNAVLNGKIAGVRIIKGTARYTGTFITPKTPLTNVSGTQLLLNFGATAVPDVQDWYEDTSSAARAVTLNGTVTRRNEGNGVIVGELIHGGGSTNISVNEISLNGEFTLETFYYLSEAQSGGWGQVFTTAVGGVYAPAADNGGKFNFRIHGGLNINSEIATQLNTWYHIAVTRDSTSTVRLYVNGLLEASGYYSGNFGLNYLGGYVNEQGISGRFAGVRVTNTALYVESSYAVPTSLPTNINGTQLLLNFGATTPPSVNQWYGNTASGGPIILNGTVTQFNQGGGVRAATFNDSGTLNANFSLAIEFQDFSVSAFVKFEGGLGREDRIINTGVHGSFAVFRNTSNLIELNHVGIGTIVASTIPITDSKWHYIYVVRTQGSVTIYIDGIQVASVGSGPIFAASSNNYIGGHAGANTFVGKIAGLHIRIGTVNTADANIPTAPPALTTGTALLLNFGATAVPTVVPSTWYDDSSLAARTVTSNGTVTQSDEGGGVVAAEFNSGYFSLTDSSLGSITQDFTFELFVKPTENSTYRAIASLGSYLNGILLRNSSNGAVDNFYVAGTYLLGGTNSYLAQNHWNHIAIVRHSNVYRLYLNGKEIVSYTYSSALDFSTMFIGTAIHNPGEIFQGKLAGIRLVVGSAVYTSNFTVPTSLPTSISGTQLLLNFGATNAPTTNSNYPYSWNYTAPDAAALGYTSGTFYTTDSTLSIGTLVYPKGPSNGSVDITGYTLLINAGPLHSYIHNITDTDPYN